MFATFFKNSDFEEFVIKYTAEYANISYINTLHRTNLNKANISGCPWAWFRLGRGVT